MWIEPARPRPGCRSLRERLGVGVLAHGGSREARGATDRGQGLAGQVTAAHLVVDGAPAGAALDAGGDLRVGPPEGAQAPAGLAVVIEHGQASQAPMGSRQPALHGLAHVEQQVPTVRHLQSARRGRRHGPGVLRRAVPGHDRDLGMTAQPCGEGRSRAVGQEVERSAALEVDDEGPVAPPLADRPVVDADHARLPRPGQRQAPHEAEHRVGAGGHREVRRQSRACLAAEREPQPAPAREPGGAYAAPVAAGASAAARRRYGADSQDGSSRTA